MKATSKEETKKPKATKAKLSPENLTMLGSLKKKLTKLL